jgi:hypothetical protein
MLIWATKSLSAQAPAHSDCAVQTELNPIPNRSDTDFQSQRQRDDAPSFSACTAAYALIVPST